MISIFAMTIKGFTSISKIIEEFGSSFINLVISARDANIENDYYEEIKKLCIVKNIRFANRKDKYDINTNFCFAISWRWLINLKKDKKLIVFHDALLPKYRGFSPLVNSLINNEKEIGVTALFASDEYDKGDIIFQSKTPIKYPMKISMAIEINNKNYIKSCLYVCSLINKKKLIKTLPQIDSDATYSLWLDEEDYRINWEQNAKEIKRFIDATGAPYKGASSFIGDKKIRIIDAETVTDLKIINRDAGKVINLNNGFPVVVCGKGLLMITNAIYDDSKTDILPLKKFRIRFK